MSTSGSFDGIDTLYKKYQKEIFKYYIWQHLFDDDVKYEDKDIFEKTEKYIRDFFVSQKFEWNDANRERIHSLVVGSDNAKLITDYFQDNYQACLETELKWTPDSSIQNMVNQLIDASFQNKIKLSYYYAKRLLVKYYYDRFADNPDKEKIIVNVMAIFFTSNDMQRLVKDVQLSLDSLIGKSYNRLVQVIGVKIDPKMFIRKYVMMKSFHLALCRNPQMLDQLSGSQYVSVYRDLIPSINDGVEVCFSRIASREKDAENASGKEEKRKEASDDSNLKQGEPEKKVETSATVKDPANEKAKQSPSKSLSQTRKETAQNISHGQTNDSLQSETNSKDGMDLFLEKIGNKRKITPDPITSLLYESAEIIMNSEKYNPIYESFGDIYYVEGFEDPDIEYLVY